MKKYLACSEKSKSELQWDATSYIIHWTLIQSKLGHADRKSKKFKPLQWLLNTCLSNTEDGYVKLQYDMSNTSREADAIDTRSHCGESDMTNIPWNYPHKNFH